MWNQKPRSQFSIVFSYGMTDEDGRLDCSKDVHYGEPVPMIERPVRGALSFRAMPHCDHTQVGEQDLKLRACYKIWPAV